MKKGLIDREKLLEVLNNLDIPYNARINEIICEMQTAFDIDKIIEKLEFLREAYSKKFDEQYDYIALITYGRIASIDVCLHMIRNELKRKEEG